jgi:hypothetical protein
MSVRPSVRLYVCLSVCPSVRIEQLGSHWTDFDAISCLSLYRKFVEKIQVLLKSDKNSGYFTWRRFHIMKTSHWIHFRMRIVWNKICRENKNTHFMFSNFFPDNRALYEILSKNVVELERPQMAKWRCVARGINMPAPVLPQSHTEICKTYCLSTAK